MNAFAALFLVVTTIALIALPRQWAIAPLLVGACYMTNGQSINLGPFHFTILRTLILVGLIRAKTEGQRLPGGLIGMDRILLSWGAWLIVCSVFHRPFAEALVFRLGVFYNVLGVYFLIRLFCQTRADVVQIIRITGFLLIPIALEMLNEKRTGIDLFGMFGGVPTDVLVRDGKLRAQGPFGHPILAGSVGGLCLPLMAGIWTNHPRAAKSGALACLMIVLASTSSGPLMATFLGTGALIFWRWRRLTRAARYAAVALYVALDIVMSRPAYYILAAIDLTGNSTGYHRAALIDSSIKHLSEWYLAGTDYTRHWMPYGVSWSPDQCDITNHYLYYGVMGGLPLMTLFIVIVWLGFSYVGRSLRAMADATFDETFLLWALGAGLFAHMASMISIAYFDQSVMFLYLNLAAIASLWVISRDGPIPTDGSDEIREEANELDMDETVAAEGTAATFPLDNPSRSTYPAASS